MKNATCILIDDIPDVLNMLEKDISRLFPSLEVIGKASSVVTAAKLLRKKSPDIIFLDIMLGDGTGFDLLEIFPDLSSKIIFITASDAYALRAFKFAAIDYVLKPYSDYDLQNAVQKAQQYIKSESQQLSVLKETLSNNKKVPERISLHTQEKIIVISLDSIIRCQSDNNYTMFFLDNGQKILVTKTLKYYSDLLKECNFMRVHQSHLINTKFIKEFIKSDGGYLLLTNKETIPVSVRKRSEVIQMLNLI